MYNIKQNLKIDKISFQAAKAIEKLESNNYKELSTKTIPLNKLAIIILIFLTILLITPYLPSVVHGFFEYDDFECIALNDNLQLNTLIFTPHGDHPLPLFRIELAIMQKLFGNFAIPYNFLNFFIFIFCSFIVLLILLELKTAYIGIFLFFVLFMGWTRWSHFLNGYFILSVYAQANLFCLIAIWSYLRWKRNPDKLWILSMFLSNTVAVFIDIAGAWVPFGFLTFILLNEIGEQNQYNFLKLIKKKFYIFVGTFSIIILSTIYYLFIFKHYGQFLSMASEENRSFFLSINQFIYLISGLIISIFFPGDLSKIPNYILIPLCILIFLLFCAFIFYLFVNLKNKKQKFNLISFVLIIFGTCLLVVIGRPMHGFSSEWATKYVSTPFTWFCIFLSVNLSLIWEKANLVKRVRMLKILCIFVCLFLSLQVGIVYVVSSFNDRPVGFIKKLENAKKRKATMMEIKSDIIMPQIYSSKNEIFIPDVEGKYLNKLYKILHKDYNLASYKSFIVPENKKITFISINANKELFYTKNKTVDNLRQSLKGTAFDREIKESSIFKKLYFSSNELDFKEGNTREHEIFSLSTDSKNKIKNFRLIQNFTKSIISDGSYELAVTDGSWTPENLHTLIIDLFSEINSDDFKLYVSFHGDMNIKYPENWITIKSNKRIRIEINLLQIYAYSLSEKIEELNVIFKTPGKYDIFYITLI